MLLKNLIKETPKDKKNILVAGISANSNEIKKNFIFFAIKGKTINGENFIDDAIKKGAIVIVCSKKCNFVNKNILVIKKKKCKKFFK